MAIAMRRNDTFGSEEEDEAFEQRGVGCQPDGFELFVRVLLRAFVVEARFAHGGDDDPVAREIDGVEVALVDGRPMTAGERPLKRVARPFAFEDHGVVRLAVEVHHRQSSWPGAPVMFCTRT